MDVFFHFYGSTEDFSLFYFIMSSYPFAFHQDPYKECHPHRTFGSVILGSQIILIKHIPPSDLKKKKRKEDPNFEESWWIYPPDFTLICLTLTSRSPQSLTQSWILYDIKYWDETNRVSLWWDSIYCRTLSCPFQYNWLQPFAPIPGCCLQIATAKGTWASLHKQLSVCVAVWERLCWAWAPGRAETSIYELFTFL